MDAIRCAIRWQPRRRPSSRLLLQPWCMVRSCVACLTSRGLRHCLRASQCPTTSPLPSTSALPHPPACRPMPQDRLQEEQPEQGGCAELLVERGPGQQPHRGQLAVPAAGGRARRLGAGEVLGVLGTGRPPGSACVRAAVCACRGPPPAYVYTCYSRHRLSSPGRVVGWCKCSKEHGSLTALLSQGWPQKPPHLPPALTCMERTELHLPPA